MSTENGPILVSINSKLFWWAFTALTLGGIGWLTNLHSSLNTHNERIGIIETQQVNQGRQLDSMDRKLDRLLENGGKKP